ncbi:MAG: hypothetical protein M3296_04965 [Actinomycetota bacterium]|nr:hypothetical protein [Actinomycetota bacterium]
MRRYAHIALAAIRMVNGVLALLAPRTLAKRLDVDADRSPALLYFQRMFGIRTILIALDLVVGDRAHTVRALRTGRVIHASDVCAAALAGLRGNLAPRPAVMTTAISLVNLALALVADPGPNPPRLPVPRHGRRR